MEKYAELKEYLKNILKTAKKLGLNVRPGGGYSMGYDINNLPPYPVGLFGALSIVEGQGARCKLGLSFDDTEALEAGFNGNFHDKNKKKKKRLRSALNDELIKLGVELAMGYMPRYRSSSNWGDPSPLDTLEVPPMPKKKKTVFGAPPTSQFVGDLNAPADFDLPSTSELKKKIAKKFSSLQAQKVAQVALEQAPNTEEVLNKIVALANEMGISAATEAQAMPAELPQNDWTSWPAGDEDDPALGEEE